MAVIGDEDSVTGLLLAGIGHVDRNQVSNFMVVGPGLYWPIVIHIFPSVNLFWWLVFRPLAYLVYPKDTQQDQIEKKLHELTTREDIAIVLITQNVAVKLQSILESYNSPLPAILEIPSKDQPYDSKKVSYPRLALYMPEKSHLFVPPLPIMANIHFPETQDVILKRVQKIFAEDTH